MRGVRPCAGVEGALDLGEANAVGGEFRFGGGEEIGRGADGGVGRDEGCEAHVARP